MALLSLPGLSLAGVARQGEMLRPRSEGVSAVITVNTLADENDGSCSDGDCSLRDAIQVAGDGDTIIFSVSGTIALTLGQLVMYKNLTISGPGASNLTISGNDASRVLLIQGGANVTLSDLTIAHGYASGSGSDRNGGGIYNLGHLTLRRCIVADNHADWDGGGIYNYSTGVLDAQQSAFIGNSAVYGGGVKNEGATISLTNCTFYNNSAVIRGGGIDSGASSTLNITNCTFSGNIRGGIANPASETTAVNTIVANNSEYNCSGGFTSSSTHNLATDDSCSPGFTQVTTAALKLAWRRWLFALQAGSVAIDAGANSACPAVDQRGAARPLDGNNDGTAVCDVGSYEYSPSWEEYPVPTENSQPYGITLDSSNGVWFTELAGNKIGRLTSASDSAASALPGAMQAVTITEYTIPTADSLPSDIALGPDGNLWFTEYAGNRIGRITPAGVITEYPLPASSAPIAITVGPDGNLWFCEEGGNRIGKMNTSGTLLAEYDVPTANSGLNDIVAGPDGALWFTEYEGQKIGRITPGGTITEYTAGAKVFGIAPGPDGNLWFTETIADRVGRITPTGSISEFDLPGDANGPEGITAGPFNSLWVVASFSNKILHVLPSGAVPSTYAIPTSASVAVMIAADGNGHLWFTEMAANQIGQLIPPVALYLPLVLRNR